MMTTTVSALGKISARRLRALGMGFAASAALVLAGLSIVAPLVYLSNYCATVAADVTDEPVDLTPASGDSCSLANSFCPSGATDALPNDAIPIDHYTSGSLSYASFTVAVQNGRVPAHNDPTSAAYAREENGLARLHNREAHNFIRFPQRGNRTVDFCISM